MRCKCGNETILGEYYCYQCDLKWKAMVPKYLTESEYQQILQLIGKQPNILDYTKIVIKLEYLKEKA